MNGISLLDMEWLGLQKKGAKGQKINSVEMEMRKEVFSEFIYWFFDSFLINLINVSSLLSRYRECSLITLIRLVQFLCHRIR